MAKTVVLALFFLLALAAPAAGKRAVAPACPASVANRLTSTGSATQLITVVAPRSGATQASLRLWRKVDGCWRAVAGPWSAWLGGRGVSASRREGIWDVSWIEPAGKPARSARSTSWSLEAST